MNNIINLTPHTLNIHSQGEVLEIAASGAVARVAAEYIKEENSDYGVDLFNCVYGEVQGLPPYRPASNTLYVVSGLVKSAVPNRHDVVSPGELIRDENGKPIGCRGLRR